MNAGTATARRALSILLFIALPATLLLLSVSQCLQFSEDTHAAQESENQITVLTRRLASHGNGRTPDITSIYVPGATRTSAVATLQQQLSSAVASASGKVIETAVIDLPVAPDEQEEQIGVRATFDIDNDGLLELLYALETQVPLISLDTLSARRLSSDPATQDGQLLRVDITTRAHWKQQGSPQ
ncbi:type II secretion system protein GspM [Ensifer soli]|uniref:type II secretion system protein GspM n=1 Tax=Ciceribacter sp. sgz301302 TaxID=3342379 RepID=UPI0035BAD5D7